MPTEKMKTFGGWNVKDRRILGKMSAAAKARREFWAAYAAKCKAKNGS